MNERNVIVGLVCGVVLAWLAWPDSARAQFYADRFYQPGEQRDLAYDLAVQRELEALRASQHTAHEFNPFIGFAPLPTDRQLRDAQVAQELLMIEMMDRQR